MQGDACDLCELEAIIKARSDAIRKTLQQINPQTDPNYDALFRSLVLVDGSLRVLRQAVAHA